jgi:hypothetical protein
MICYFEREEEVECQLVISIPAPYKIAQSVVEELRKRFNNGEDPSGPFVF